MIDQKSARNCQPPPAPAHEADNTIATIGYREAGERGRHYASDEPFRVRGPLRHPIIGTSPVTRAALRDASRVAPTEVPILLLGETGTGKELFARAIHEWSPRAARPIVRVDCASLTRALCEVDLSGYEPGVLTGGKQRGPSLIERASCSTLFLDEIGELPLELQPKLLHVLGEAEWRPEGENGTSHANVRVVAASTQGLGDEVLAGRFRADLYYRVAGFVIHLPTLRERRGDIGPLVQHFVTMHAQKYNCMLQPLSVQTLAQLEHFDWPGNVRELRWAVERACIAARNGVLSIDDFAIGARHATVRKSTRREQSHCACESSLQTLREVERQHIASVLRRCGGVIEGRHGAAVALGLPPSTLRFRIRKHGIELPLIDQQPHQHRQQTR